MKHKKLLSILCAAALTITVAGVAGCKGKEEHEVAKWTTSVGREVTCVEDGEEQGECVKCGDKQFRTVPSDPTKLEQHDYGEWQVDPVPTETTTGTATKTCSRNCTTNHTRTVTLPALTDGAYTSSVTVQPSVIKEGERTYIYADEAGEISFKVGIPKPPISTVADAAEVGAYNGSLIRKTEANVLDTSIYTDYLNGKYTRRDVSAYFGDDYVHVLDADNKVDDWYSHDGDGKLFAIRTSDRDEDGLLHTESINDATEDCFKGFPFLLFHSKLGGYGAEGLLNSLNVAAKEGGTNYEADMSKAAQRTYSFAFDYSTVSKDDEGNDVASDTLSNHLSVNFRLSEDGAIEYLKIEELAYEVYVYLVPEDENGEGGYKTDENGKLVMEEGGRAPTPHYAGTMEITQTVKTPDDVVPANSYSYDKSYVRSFDIKYNNKTVADGEAVEVASNAAEKFTFENVSPATASLDYDQPTIYLRTDVRDIPLNASYGSVNVLAFYDVTTKKLTVNSRVTGEITIVLKTRGMQLTAVEGQPQLTEKLLKLNVSVQAPSNQTYMVAEYYAYNDTSGAVEYEWLQKAHGATIGEEPERVYVGQEIICRLGMDEGNPAAQAEAPYVDLSFTTKVYEVVGSNTTLTDKATAVVFAADSPEGSLYDCQIAKFVATRPGRYALRLYSALKTNMYRRIYIEVVAAPDIAESFTDGAQYSCSLVEPDAADVKVTIINGASWAEGELKIEIDGPRGLETATFTYSVNAQTGKITTAYKSGARYEYHGFDIYDFKLSINEVYKLVLSHPDGFGEVDENGENVVSYEKRILTLGESTQE